MLGSKFDEIMREQPSNLNVYEEYAKIQAKVKSTNQLLKSLRHGHQEETCIKKEKRHQVRR